MIVERWTVPVKPGQGEEVVKILKEELTWHPGLKHGFRVYLPKFGAQDVVVYEFEVENVQELEAGWATWRSKRGTPDYFGRWRSLTERGAERVVWELAASR